MNNEKMKEFLESNFSPEVLNKEIVERFLKGYGSYHNHTEVSNFRLKDCIIKIEQLIDTAIVLGYKSVAITDHEALSGHKKFLNRYNKLLEIKKRYDNHAIYNKNDDEIQKNLHIMQNWVDDFKPVLGNEIYLVDDIEDVVYNYVSGETKFYHFILLAKNRKGYQQIKEISASAWDNWFKTGKFERVPTGKPDLERIIGNEKGNIIATSACLGSQVAQLALKYFRDGDEGARKSLHKMITWCIRVFGQENFFIELQPFLTPSDGTIKDQMIYNQAMIKVANAYGLRYTIATDSHYLKKEHRQYHEAYLTADGDNTNNRELEDFYETTYMVPKDEIIELMSTHLSLEEISYAFESTVKIHDMIEIYSLDHGTIVPRDKNIPEFNLTHSMSEYYETIAPYIKKFAYSDDVQERYFLYKCEEGLVKKNITITEEIVKRINVEMEEIWEASERINMRIAPYYILVETLVNKIMWNISYVGVARGSVTGFFTAYLLEITQMNPMKYGLPHWRHLSKERPELPDVDLDSEASKRHLIFEAMKDYYGFDNVLNILTLKTEGSKSTVLTVCRGWRGNIINEETGERETINGDTAQSIADMIPFERGSNWSLTECFEGSKDGKKPIKEFINAVDEFEGLKDTLLMIEGLVCGRSIHASGVYVFDNGYLEHNARMRAPNGSYITAYTMTDSDEQGGLKVDCLTIKALDKIHVTMDLLVEYGKIEDQGSIKATYDKYIHPDVLELEDPEMWRMIAENTLIDAFQFDTDVGADAGMKVEPTSLPELAVANSLMRLMADGDSEQPIDVYIKHKNDINLWYDEMKEYKLNDDEIKVLEPHLKHLYGVADTQEVVMEMVMDKYIADFNIVESNKLRKGIAKKKKELLDKLRKLFYEKADSIGVRYELVRYVWEVQIKRQLGLTLQAQVKLGKRKQKRCLFK